MTKILLASSSVFNVYCYRFRNLCALNFSDLFYIHIDILFHFQRCILKNCEKLIELVVVKLHQDWFSLLDLLAMVLSPNSK